MGYKATDSQANFIFVDLKRPAKGFRDAVAQHGVLVGRDFPPYEKTHCRISIGTRSSHGVVATSIRSDTWCRGRRRVDWRAWPRSIAVLARTAGLRRRADD